MQMTSSTLFVWDAGHVSAQSAWKTSSLWGALTLKQNHIPNVSLCDSLFCYSLLGLCDLTVSSLMQVPGTLCTATVRIATSFVTVVTMTWTGNGPALPETGEPPA